MGVGSILFYLLFYLKKLLKVICRIIFDKKLIYLAHLETINLFKNSIEI